MSNVRRWYIYLVSAVSLQAVAWALITLARNLFIARLDPPTSALAFQIAVVIIGLPIFLGHWLWGQHLSRETVAEQGATLRRLYLYGLMAAFLGPFLANAFDLIGSFLRAGETLRRHPFSLTGADALVYHVVALLILALLWWYHHSVLREESRTVPLSGHSTTVRRLYVLGFSAAGLTMTTVAIIQLIRWLLFQVGETVIRSGSLDVGLATEATRLLVGASAWLIFWYWAQKLFDSAGRAERESVLRKFYLYGAIFIGVLGGVTNAAGILAGLFRRLLDLPPQGDIRDPMAMIIGLSLVWALHAFLLRDDSKKMAEGPRHEVPRQLGVQRLYLYLVGAIGLAALLIGLGGDISVLLRSLEEGFGRSLREQLAWSTAAIIAGLPVWLIPWRSVQTIAAEISVAGKAARRSIVRKIYLYFFLFVAAMTVLSGVIFIVAGLLTWLLGSDPPTLSELGHAIAFSLIAIGVWLYHGLLLRGDGQLAGQERLKSLAALHLEVLDVADGQFGRAVIAALKQEAPDLALEPLLLANDNGQEAEAEKSERSEKSKTEPQMVERISQADVIVGPWQITLPGAAGGLVSPAVAQAVLNSPARKLLLPTPSTGWDWIGVEHLEPEDLVKQSVQAIKQIAAGEPVTPLRSLGIGPIIAIVVGGLLLLVGVVLPLLAAFVF